MRGYEASRGLLLARLRSRRERPLRAIPREPGDGRSDEHGDDEERDEARREREGTEGEHAGREPPVGREETGRRPRERPAGDERRRDEDRGEREAPHRARSGPEVRNAKRSALPIGPPVAKRNRPPSRVGIPKRSTV